MIADVPASPECRHLSFRFAREQWEKQQYHALRRAIFCQEQGIFEGTDRDERDEEAIPIIAARRYMGLADDVVGVVRIDEPAPGVWWGSRLGVAPRYRSKSDFAAHDVFPNDEPPSRRFSSVGATLIYKAVSTAVALGCRRFYAHVQEQNVRFFRWLHWEIIEEVTLHGRVHQKMEADLSHYPASDYVHEQKHALQPA